MTLGEIKDAIENLVESYGEEILDEEVFAEYDYGDRHHTRATTRFNDLLKIPVTKSAYSDSGLAIADDSDDDDVVEDLGEKIIFVK